MLNATAFFSVWAYYSTRLDKALSWFIKAILPDSRISFSIFRQLVSKQNYQHPIYCQVEFKTLLYFRRGDHVSPEEDAKNDLTHVEPLRKRQANL